MIILGIESSCDETGVGIIHYDPLTRKRVVLSNTIISQIRDHIPYGGVIPEIAARNHLFYWSKALKHALNEAQITLQDITHIGVTAGPGLIGGVLVGVMAAKGLALGLNVPLYGINHLEAHALSPRLQEDIPFPFLLLLVSGGHCQFVIVKGVGDYTLLGGTLDDAVGETFDKVGKMMGLSYPAGPLIEKRAQKGNPDAFSLPRPLLYAQPHAVLSFSGLKTAVKNIVDQHTKQADLDDVFIDNLSASFQTAVCDVLCFKSKKILQETGLNHLVVAGGVSANQFIRSSLQNATKELNVTVHTPPLSICTDNGVMVAWTVIEHLNAGRSIEEISAKSRWPL